MWSTARLGLLLAWPLTAMPVFAQRAPDPPGQVPRDVQLDVTVLTTELLLPWSLAVLPVGSLLITEENGTLRLFRDGSLSEDLLQGALEISVGTSGLMDVVLHPDFSQNGQVYVTYMKPGPCPGGDGTCSTTALARGRFDGHHVSDVADVFVADAWGGPNQGGDASRATFGTDGAIYFGVSHRQRQAQFGPQVLTNHYGKILRLSDDGSVPEDNPFVGAQGAKPEIFSYGHRTIMGLAVNPATGELWETENGPLGGDEVNVIRAGENYGWPVVSYGRQYNGSPIGDRAWQEGMTDPLIHWTPSITTSGLFFHDGTQFPEWAGNLFVGSMIVGRIEGTGHLERVILGENGEQGREWLLKDFGQRVRYAAQDRAGAVYVLTDEGSLIKVQRAK